MIRHSPSVRRAKLRYFFVNVTGTIRSARIRAGREPDSRPVLDHSLSPPHFRHIHDATLNRIPHDRDLATAFDGQAARFEKAPVQTDPLALARLVFEANLPPDSLILDAGCGPGLVSQAFLEAGHRVIGVDLSDEMVARARVRCDRFGDRARFERQSLYDPPPGGPFDASISRYVLHHVADPLAFLRRQVELIRPGGLVVLSDHVTDPDPLLADEHNAIEWLRDRTHTRNLSPGAIVDLFASAGLGEIRLTEEAFTLDFDEWFDRGTHAAPKLEVRDLILASRQPIRGFRRGRRRGRSGDDPLLASDRPWGQAAGSLKTIPDEAPSKAVGLSGTGQGLRILPSTPVARSRGRAGATSPKGK